MEPSLLISGMVIPVMAMPSIFIPPGVESWWLVCSEWQSELIETNAHDRSQAAANEEAHSSIATTEPANIRLIITPISILRQIVPPVQLREIARIYL